jgi:hypothetical protein
MEHLIEVSHLNGAWCLAVCGCFEPTLFQSGARAEAAARNLAGRLALHGCEARVCIRDSKNLVVGEHRYFACRSIDPAGRASAH